MTYNPRKAAQVVAFFALKTGDSAINVLKAVKLVYLADRENFARSGFPILDERRVSMKRGPVNSTTYNYINGEVQPKDDLGWSEFVSDRENHLVGLANNDLTVEDLDELSDSELISLENVWDALGHLDQWQLEDFTHDPKNVPEWSHPREYGSIAIPLVRILDAVGIQHSKAQADEIERVNFASTFLKGL